MSRTSRFAAIGAAAAVASLGFAGPAPAQSQGAQVYNYGQCVDQGYPYNADGYGPMVFVVSDATGFKFIQPQGVSAFGPAADPAGLIACSVAPGA
jgi:hypothetical protein